MEKLIIDTLVDVVSEKSISPRRQSGRGYKKGFFLEKPYLPSKTTLKSSRPLVSRDWVEKEIKAGLKLITVPSNAIITPMARLLIDEKGIRVERC